MRNSLLEVTPVIPGCLSRLTELAANLVFSWHRPTRALFQDLDPALRNHTTANPRLTLRCVHQLTLHRYARHEASLARSPPPLGTLAAYFSLTAPARDQPLGAYSC